MLSLSVSLSAGGASRTLLLKNDADVEKSVQLWGCYPGTAGIIDIAMKEEGGAASNLGRGGGAAGSWEPPPGGSRPPRPAPPAAPAHGNQHSVYISETTSARHDRAPNKGRCEGESGKVVGMKWTC